MIYRFTEVLNDLVNYFLLGDILLLENWKQANHLSDDLAMEFTTNESGDRVFSEGIVIPMTGIENYPYTILFNLSGDRPELRKERIDRSCAKKETDCSLEKVAIPSK